MSAEGDHVAPGTAATPPTVDHSAMANAIRALAMDAVEKAKSGHPGMPMGMADIATVLFSKFLKFDPKAPHWPDRDRFVLSNGHGSMLQYAVQYLAGYEDITLDEVRNFRQLGSRTAGHPEYHLAAGIETTTGPLGQGLGNGVGMAIAERLLAARFGSAIVDHYTYVLAGDGCLMEGISHEAISLAGHLRLSKLIVLFDDNQVSIDGPTQLAVSDDQLARFRACGWEVRRIDGHDPAAIEEAIAAAQTTDRPSLIACRTLIGYGSPNKGGKASAHGAPLGADEIALTRDALGWPHEPFVIPDDILAAWRALGARGDSERAAWSARLDALDGAARAAWDAGQERGIPDGLDAALDRMTTRYVAETPGWATRKASQEVLGELTQVVPTLIGGSADLTGSNLTRPAGLPEVAADDFSGRYIYYGVREHGMAAAMNGIALHGGLIPYGGTFLCFTDYCRPSLRLSALMEQRVVYVMTHDSIGQGEDGPTHQPIEHLASLRAIPNLYVYRPADAVETAECWVLALSQPHSPSVLVLSRQGAPLLRTEKAGENLSARGGYVLAEADGARAVTILATGTEVALALAAREQLQADGVGTAVVSMPCWERFEEQPADYRSAVLGDAPRIAVETASPFGWTRYVAREDHVVGMTTFGASGPGAAVLKHFGFTPESVAAKAREVMAESTGNR